MALQRKLGLLSERRTWVGAAYSSDLTLNRTAFDNVSSVTTG